MGACQTKTEGCYKRGSPTNEIPVPAWKCGDRRDCHHCFFGTKAGRRFRSGIGWRSFAAAGVRGTRPFAKNAKERGTRSGGDASQNQEPGPPAILANEVGLAGGDPDLVCDDCHHEEKVEAESPEDHEFGAFEVTAGDGVLFGFDELVGFEGGEDPGLIGGCGVGFGPLHHLGYISFTTLI